MATITFHPTSDITLGHSCSTGSTGWNLLGSNDGDSTYINGRCNSSDIKTYTSNFGFSGAFDKAVIVKSIAIYVVGRTLSTNSKDTKNYSINLSINGTAGTAKSGTLGSSYTTYSNTYTQGLPSSPITNIGQLNLNLQITNSGKQESSKTDAFDNYFTEAYIVVTYEESTIPSYNCAAIAGANINNVSVSNPTVLDGETVTFTATLNPGCSFDGWYTAASGGTKVSGNEIYTTTINANITLYAKAIKNTYTIAVGVTPNGSTSVNRSTAQYGDEVVFAATPDEYYDFLGWYDNSSFSGTPITSNPYRTTTITANTVLYAKFVHKTVTFGIDHPAPGGTNVNWVSDLYVVVLDKSAMNDVLWEALWSNNWDVVRSSNACLNHKENHVSSVGPMMGSSSKQHISAFDVPMGAFVAFTGTYTQTSSTYSAFGMGQARFGYHKGLMSTSTQYDVTSTMRTGASFGNMPPSAWPDGLPPHKGDIAYIDCIMSNTMVYHFVGYSHVNIIESNRPTGETYQIKPAPHASRLPNQLELFSTSVDEVTFEVGTTDSRWEFEGFYSDSNYANLLTRNNPAVLPTYNNIYKETSPLVIDNVTITNSTYDKYAFKVYAKFTTEYPTTKATAVAKEGIRSASVNNTYPVIVGDSVEYSCQVAEHYVFDGWYLDEECTELVSNVKSFTYTTTQADVDTLYAKATPIVYAITLEQADGGTATATPSMGMYGTNSTLRWEDSLGWYDFNYWAKLENVSPDYMDADAHNKVNSSGELSPLTVNSTPQYWNGPGDYHEQLDSPYISDTTYKLQLNNKYSVLFDGVFYNNLEPYSCNYTKSFTGGSSYVYKVAIGGPDKGYPFGFYSPESTSRYLVIAVTGDDKTKHYFGIFTNYNVVDGWVEISNTNPYDYVIEDNTSIKPFISEKPWYYCTVDGEYTNLISISAVQGHVVAGDAVTFSYNGGSAYTFFGWYSDEECTQLVSEEENYTFTPDANVVLYAKIKQPSTSTGIYIKQNGGYIVAKAVYKKENGFWVEQTDYTSIFNTDDRYRIRQ